MSAEIEALRREIRRLNAERERTLFERKSDLDAAERSIKVAKEAGRQRDEVVAALQRIALDHGLTGENAWSKLMDNPGVVADFALKHAMSLLGGGR